VGGVEKHPFSIKPIVLVVQASETEASTARCDRPLQSRGSTPTENPRSWRQRRRARCCNRAFINADSPEIQLQAHFFGLALGNDKLEAGNFWRFWVRPKKLGDYVFPNSIQLEFTQRPLLSGPPQFLLLLAMSRSGPPDAPLSAPRPG